MKISKINHKKNFKKALKLLKEEKTIIYLVFFFLVVMVVVGFINPNLFVNLQEQAINYIMAKVAGKNIFQLMLFIILNNLQAALVPIIFGVFFAMVPLLSLLFNGYFIGAVLSRSVEKTGYIVLWRLIPHGIFEIPAICIAISFGIRIGVSLFKGKLKQSYKDTFLVFFYIILPLIVVAGIVEGLLFYVIG